MGLDRSIPYQYKPGEVISITEEEQEALIHWDGKQDVREFLDMLRKVDPVAKVIEDRKQSGFVVKDSGERREFGTGMVRDTNAGKVRYDLAFDGPIFERFARQLTLGAEKYNPRNWMQARTKEEYDRFRESAMRHTVLWYTGHRDEDHAAAAVFNFNGAEYTRDRMIAEGTWTEEVKHG